MSIFSKIKKFLGFADKNTELILEAIEYIGSDPGEDDPGAGIPKPGYHVQVTLKQTLEDTLYVVEATTPLVGFVRTKTRYYSSLETLKNDWRFTKAQLELLDRFAASTNTRKEKPCDIDPKKDTIKARFIGRDGSMGFSTGCSYTLNLSLIQMGMENWCLMVRSIASPELFCMYSTKELLLENWEITNPASLLVLNRVAESLNKKDPRFPDRSQYTPSGRSTKEPATTNKAKDDALAEHLPILGLYIGKADDCGYIENQTYALSISYGISPAGRPWLQVAPYTNSKDTHEDEESNGTTPKYYYSSLHLSTDWRILNPKDRELVEALENKRAYLQANTPSAPAFNSPKPEGAEEELTGFEPIRAYYMGDGATGFKPRTYHSISISCVDVAHNTLALRVSSFVTQNVCGGTSIYSDGTAPLYYGTLKHFYSDWAVEIPRDIEHLEMWNKKLEYQKTKLVDQKTKLVDEMLYGTYPKLGREQRDKASILKAKYMWGDWVFEEGKTYTIQLSVRSVGAYKTPYIWVQEVCTPSARAYPYRSLEELFNAWEFQSQEDIDFVKTFSLEGYGS